MDRSVGLRQGRPPVSASGLPLNVAGSGATASGGVKGSSAGEGWAAEQGVGGHIPSLGPHQSSSEWRDRRLDEVPVSHGGQRAGWSSRLKLALCRRLLLLRS